jgi:phage terminase large subunit-like protein
MAANVAVAQDPAGNIKPAKDKSTERIDGIVALIMAIGRAMVAHEEPQPSYQMFVL